MDALKLARLARAKELQEECAAMIAPIFKQILRLQFSATVARVTCDVSTGQFRIYEDPGSARIEIARLDDKMKRVLAAYQDQFAKEFDGQSERLRSSSKNQ